MLLYSIYRLRLDGKMSDLWDQIFKISAGPGIEPRAFVVGRLRSYLSHQLRPPCHLFYRFLKKWKSKILPRLLLTQCVVTTQVCNVLPFWNKMMKSLLDWSFKVLKYIKVMFTHTHLYCSQSWKAVHFEGKILVFYKKGKRRYFTEKA